MAQGDLINVRASSAATAGGSSAAVRCSGADQIALLVDVTAVAGATPSMTVSVEWSSDGVSWFTSDTAESFAAITAAAKRTREYDVRAPYFRVVWTVTGTAPSFTFSVDAYLN